MTEKQFLMVPFHGTDLTAVEVNGELHVALKPVCEAIGLDWSAQYRRINRDPILSTCIAITAMQVPGEIQNREVMTLPISHLNGFLFGISASRTRPEVMESLILYQRECYKVLHDYWIKGGAINPRAMAPAGGSAGEVLALIKALKGESNPAAQRLIHAMLQQACDARQIPVPPVHELAGHDAELWRETLERFETVLMMLAGLDIDPNLHRKPDQLLAINLPAFMDLCRQNRIETPSAHALRTMFPRHPQFNGHGAVNCRDGRVRHCWTFTRTPDHASA